MSSSAGGKTVTDEDYGYDHTHKPLSMELYTTSECDIKFHQKKDSSVQLLEFKDYAGIHTVNKKSSGN